MITKPLGYPLLFIFLFLNAAVHAQHVKPKNDLEDKLYKGKVSSVIELISEDSSGGKNAALFISKKKFAFNEKGDFIEIVSYKEDNTIDHKVVYEYDNNGNLSQEKRYEATESNGLAMEYLYKYFYNSKNQLQEEKHYIDEEGEEKLDESYQYKYDTLGNISEIKILDAEYKQTKRTSFIYDKKGNMIEIKNYDSGDHQDQKQILSYDKNDNRTDVIEFGKDGKQIARYLLLYDKNNRLLEAKRLDASGKILNRNIFTYDVNGMESSSSNFGAGNKMTYEKTESYKYDNLKNWIEKTEIKKGQPKKLVTTTRREIKYY